MDDNEYVFKKKDKDEKVIRKRTRSRSYSKNRSKDASKNYFKVHNDKHNSQARDFKEVKENKDYHYRDSKDLNRESNREVREIREFREFKESDRENNNHKQKEFRDHNRGGGDFHRDYHKEISNDNFNKYYKDYSDKKDIYKHARASQNDFLRGGSYKIDNKRDDRKPLRKDFFKDEKSNKEDLFDAQFGSLNNINIEPPLNSNYKNYNDNYKDNFNRDKDNINKDKFHKEKDYDREKYRTSSYKKRSRSRSKKRDKKEEDYPFSDKILIRETIPGTSFVGLLIGPRGSFQKELEKKSGCRVIIKSK